MPILPKAIAKIVSLILFILTTAFKVLCIVIINGSADAICLRGWHVSNETGMLLLLVAISLIPDILMIICISIGITSKPCNMGADPASIIYNFIVGFIAIGAMITFFGVEDCKSSDLVKIKSVRLFAAVAGVFHIASAILGFLSLAPEESSPPVSHNRIILDALPSSSRASRAKATKPASPKKV